MLQCCCNPACCRTILPVPVPLPGPGRVCVFSRRKCQNPRPPPDECSTNVDCIRRGRPGFCCPEPCNKVCTLPPPGLIVPQCPNNPDRRTALCPAFVKDLCFGDEDCRTQNKGQPICCKGPCAGNICQTKGGPLSDLDPNKPCPPPSRRPCLLFPVPRDQCRTSADCLRQNTGSSFFCCQGPCNRACTLPPKVPNCPNRSTGPVACIPIFPPQHECFRDTDCIRADPSKPICCRGDCNNICVAPSLPPPPPPPLCRSRERVCKRRGPAQCRSDLDCPPSKYCCDLPSCGIVCQPRNSCPKLSAIVRRRRRCGRPCSNNRDCPDGRSCCKLDLCGLMCY